MEKGSQPACSTTLAAPDDTRVNRSDGDGDRNERQTVGWVDWRKQDSLPAIPASTSSSSGQQIGQATIVTETKKTTVSGWQ